MAGDQEPTQNLVDDVISDGCDALVSLERVLETALQRTEAKRDS